MPNLNLLVFLIGLAVGLYWYALNMDRKERD